MKKVFLVPLAVMIIAALIFAGCAGGGGGGGKTIQYSEAKDYIGQTVTACGPVAIAAVDEMAPMDPKPFIVVLGELGASGDFGSTNFRPGNMSMRIGEENDLVGQLGGVEAAKAYFMGKELCVTGTIEETPVGTIGTLVDDMAQLKFK